MAVPSSTRQKKSRKKGSQGSRRSFGPVVRIAVIVSAGVLIVAGIIGAAYVSLSQAVITLTPKKQDLSTSFTIRVGKGVQEENGVPTQLAGVLFDRQLEEKKTIEQLAEQEIDAQAGGTVRLINKRNGPLKLVKTTQLKPKGRELIFRIQESVSIPAQGEVSVRVLSDTPGVIGEIPASEFEIVKLFESWKDQIYGVSDAPMTGGYIKAEILTQEQIDTLGTAFAEERKTASLEQIRTEHPNLTFPDNGVVAEVEGVDTSAKPGERVERLELTARIRIVALAFQEYALLDAALQRLKKTIPAGYEFLGISPDSFQYTVDTYDLERGTANLSASIAGTSIASIDPESFDRKKLAGRDALETANYFEENTGIEGVDVYFAPFWTTSIPMLTSHTEIVVERPAPELPKPAAEPTNPPTVEPTPAGATPAEPADGDPTSTSDMLPPNEDAPRP